MSENSKVNVFPRGVQWSACQLWIDHSILHTQCKLLKKKAIAYLCISLDVTWMLSWLPVHKRQTIFFSFSNLLHFSRKFYKSKFQVQFTNSICSLKNRYQIFWKSPMLFPQWLYQFISTAIVHKGSLFSISSPRWYLTQS